MNVELITPDETVFSGQAISAQLPSIDGLFEVLENHAPLIAALGSGQVTIMASNNTTEVFTISGGFAEVLNDNVMILAEKILPTDKVA